MRNEGRADRRGGRASRLHRGARDHRQAHRQRQAPRMLQQAVLALRRVHAQGFHGIRRAAAEEPAALLRDVPGLLRVALPAPREVPVRLQRVRVRAQLPDAQEVLSRPRRPGQLRGHARQQPPRRARGRGGRRGDGRGPVALHPQGAVRPQRRREQPRHVREDEGAHGLRLDQRGPVPREAARPALRLLAQRQAEEGAGDQGRRQVPRGTDHPRDVGVAQGACRRRGVRARHRHRVRQREDPLHDDLPGHGPRARVPPGQEDRADHDAPVQHAYSPTTARSSATRT